jgi:transcriptional regulator with XRE-family HTH domain
MDTTPKKTPPSKVRLRRLKRGLSLADLSAETGIGEGELSKIETLKLVPSPGYVERLAKFYGVKPERLRREVAATREQAGRAA